LSNSDHPPRTSLPARSRFRRPAPRVLALIAGGGALGATLRYAFIRWWPATDAEFPWATLASNLLGCFALGALLTHVITRHPPGHPLRLLGAVGFLGTLTTFSTFVVEVDHLFTIGQPARALVYLAATVTGGLGLCWLGIRAARVWAVRQVSA
jgi:fluoride exporter